MSIKKLTAIVFAGAVLMAGAIGISMKLTQQHEVEMDVADIPKDTEEKPEPGDIHTFGNMENIPLYYDDEKKLLLPLRNVTEGLGGSVEWERESRQATVSCFGRVLKIFPGKETGTLNGYEITLPEPAEMINGCLYIDSGRLTDYFNVEVIWNNESRQITLKTGASGLPAVAVRRMEGKKDGSAFAIDVPVIIGLNDANFEKNLNESLTEELRTLGEEYLDAAKDKEGMLWLDAGTDFLTKDFISIWWDGEKDSVPFRRAKNIDLQGQRTVSLSDLLAANSLEKVKAAVDGWQDGGFYLSETEGLVLLTEDENGGTQTCTFSGEELRWKDGFRELAGR